MEKCTEDICLVTGDVFRVERIFKEDGNYLPIKKGLRIQKAYFIKNKKYYYDLATLTWNNDKNHVEFKDICLRSINVLKEISEKNLNEYLNCIDFAEDCLYDVYKERKLK